MQHGSGGCAGRAGGKAPRRAECEGCYLFAGKNDHEAVAHAGAGGHKEINRTNLSSQRVEEGLRNQIVQQQLELLKFRNTFPAFGFDAKLQITQEYESALAFVWEQNGYTATLRADFVQATFTAEGINPEGERVFWMQQD